MPSPTQQRMITEMCEMAPRAVKKRGRIEMAVGQCCAALEPRVRADCPAEIRSEIGKLAGRFPIEVSRMLFVP
jgi:hypothetical protein